jgi:hypothetical protein
VGKLHSDLGGQTADQVGKGHPPILPPCLEPSLQNHIHKHVQKSFKEYLILRKDILRFRPVKYTFLSLAEYGTANYDHKMEQLEWLLFLIYK